MIIDNRKYSNPVYNVYRKIFLSLYENTYETTIRQAMEKAGILITDTEDQDLLQDIEFYSITNFK